VADTIVFTIRNILKRKKRAFLTLLGIFIGLTAVVALTSLGQGLQQTINEQFQKAGADKILIQAKELGYGGQYVSRQLGETDVNIVRKSHGVQEATGHLFRSTAVKFNQIQRVVNMMNIPEKTTEAKLTYEVHTIELDKGRLLTHNDKGKAVVGYNLANTNVFGRNIEVGSKIIANNTILDVVGTIKRIGDPLLDSTVIVAEEDIRNIINEPEIYSMILVQTIPGEDPDKVAENIEKSMRRNRHQKEGKEDFTIQTSTDLIESFNNVFAIIQFVFIGIAAISLIVGGIGIMNTMYTSVLERTKDIGIMKAIGATNKDIMKLFLLESSILGLIGGITGITLGIIISVLVSYFTNSYFGQGTLNFALPLWLVVGTLIFATLVGSISGMLPARRASKMKPVDALRYE
jgi:putative ABC transport system permease protein